MNCVEPLRRDHVGLVENEYLESVTSRCKGSALTQITGIIDTVVTGCVDLDNV